MFVDRKEKSITQATCLYLAFHRALEAGTESYRTETLGTLAHLSASDFSKPWHCAGKGKNPCEIQRIVEKSWRSRRKKLESLLKFHKIEKLS